MGRSEIEAEAVPGPGPLPRLTAGRGHLPPASAPLSFVAPRVLLGTVEEPRSFVSFGWLSLLS